MTRPEAIKAIYDMASRMVDLLHDTGVQDTSTVRTADAAVQAVAVTALEIDAVT